MFNSIKSSVIKKQVTVLRERNKFGSSLSNLQSPIVSFGPRFRFPHATLHHLNCTSLQSLNIGAFSNYLTINHEYYLFLCLQHSHLHTPSLPTLPIRDSIPHLYCHKGCQRNYCFFLVFFFSKVQVKQIKVKLQCSQK